MKTIFLWELKRNRKAFIIWTIISILMIASQMAVFPSFVKDADSQAALVSKYPAALVEAFGIEKVDMTNILEYFSVKIFPIIAMLGSIYIMLLGTGILSKEQNEKTIEFLLSKPITRNMIITSKQMCVLAYTALYNLILFLSSFGMIEAYKNGKDYDVSGLILIYVSLFLLNLTFASIGFLISIFVIKLKSNYSISIGVVLGSYFISVIASSSKEIDALKYLSFFKYSDAPNIINSGSIEPIYLGLYAAFIIVPMILSYVFFNKKRITA